MLTANRTSPCFCCFVRLSFYKSCAGDASGSNFIKKKWTSLNRTSQAERYGTYTDRIVRPGCAFIREEMNKIIKNDRSNALFPIEPTTKKQNIEKSMLEEYEDTSGNESHLEEKEDDNFNSDVVDYIVENPYYRVSIERFLINAFKKKLSFYTY